MRTRPWWLESIRTVEEDPPVRHAEQVGIEMQAEEEGLVGASRNAVQLGGGPGDQGSSAARRSMLIVAW
jgi:hypothetical protein